MVVRGTARGRLGCRASGSWRGGGCGTSGRLGSGGQGARRGCLGAMWRPGGAAVGREGEREGERGSRWGPRASDRGGGLGAVSTR
jgi:hypothetical protein